MRSLIISFSLLLSITLFSATAFSQVNISINDVVKIHLVNAAGYLGGSFRNDYDLLPENGQWKSYQTHEKLFGPSHKKVNGKLSWNSRDSAEHKFIKIVPVDSINLFLKALRTVKPKFTPADLKISIPQLTEQVDTAELKRLDKKRVQIFNSFFDSPTKLYHLLDTLQSDYWTDDNPYCMIEIIKKSGDTVKVITTRQVDYMLPWEINGVYTYNLNINTFFINTTGVSDHRMSGKYLPYRIYSWVDFLYARKAFELLRWQESAPENAEFIRQHFDIISISNSNENSQFTFHPKQLNQHIIIGGYLNINNKAQLVALTSFAEDTVSRFLKTSGFMIDSCEAKPGCNISFMNSDGQASHYYYSESQKSLDEYMKKYDHKQLKPFVIKAGDQIEDFWVALPDGKFVLTSYIGNYAVGVLPRFLNKDGDERRKFVFMIFTRDGKLVPGNGN